MGKLTFRGGIHPYEGKELSKDHPIEKYLPKGDLVYPLSQHIGAPSVPCVKKGDTVLAGQKIADAGGFVSVPLHASVSGTVKGIEKRLNATGDTGKIFCSSFICGCLFCLCSDGDFCWNDNTSGTYRGSCFQCIRF